MHITDYICRTYEEVFYYSVNKDIAIAAQALHDISKPFVFQWNANGSSLTEYPIAGQGAHHALALAEVIYRGFPAEEVVAQACAHGAPTSKKEEADVAGWLKAAAIIAGKDPVATASSAKTARRFPSPTIRKVTSSTSATTTGYCRRRQPRKRSCSSKKSPIRNTA